MSGSGRLLPVLTGSSSAHRQCPETECYEAGKTGAKPSAVRQAVKDVGNSRKKVEQELRSSQGATHLAVALRVVASHLHQRRVDVSTAKARVLEAAERVAEGVAGPDTEQLVARLERLTGCPIAKLAEHAERWI